jgi:imidazolonepropionase-like amidohydrolase
MPEYQLPEMIVWTQFDDAASITEALAELYDAKIKLAVNTDHAVARARKLGLSWEAIGTQLNMSRQAAWEKWAWTDEGGRD